MATTNRSDEYAKHGAYYTPIALARAIVDRMHLEPGDVVLEPSAGGGSFLEALIARDRRERLGLTILAMDCNADAPSMRSTSPSYARSVQSFLAEPVHWPIPSGDRGDLFAQWWATHSADPVPAAIEVQGGDPYPDDWPVPDVVIGNPPFGIKLPIPDEVRRAPIAVAEHHARRAVTLARRDVLLLLPQSFGGSQRRAAGLFADHPYTGDLTVTPRPSFTGGGNDASEYAVFWWSKHAARPAMPRQISGQERPDLQENAGDADAWMSMFSAYTGRLEWERD